MDVTFWVQLGAKVLILSCTSTGVVDFSIKVCLLKVGSIAADDRRATEMGQFVDRWFRTMTHWKFKIVSECEDFYSVQNVVPDTF